MIKIENVDIYGWEAAIRGMRNPKNSWDKSDTAFWSYPAEGVAHKIGENDLKLMRTLANAGTDHGKFMRFITVTCDIVAPDYWFKEFSTYKVGTVENSTSTMHKITSRALTIDDFSHEHLVPGALSILYDTIDTLNEVRESYLIYDTLQEQGKLRDDAPKNKHGVWMHMIQLLPMSYNYRRTVQLNYAVLRNMYHARKSHKLDEWKDFCRWIESLPYSELITGGKNDEQN